MLTPSERDFWEAYRRSSGVSESVPVRASMAGNLAIADKLLELYLDGRKTAGSGLVRDYEAAGDPLPAVGDYWIILSAAGAPRCIVRTVRVVQNAFEDVTEEIARAEGEGDLSLAYWREAHERFFTPFLERLGIRDLGKAVVVTEFFEVVYRG